MIGRKNKNEDLRREIAELKVLIQGQANAIKSLHDFHNNHELLLGKNTSKTNALQFELNRLKKALSTKNETIELLESVLSELRLRNKRAEQKIVKLKRKLRVVTQTKKELEKKFHLQKYSSN